MPDTFFETVFKQFTPGFQEPSPVKAKKLTKVNVLPCHACSAGIIEAENSLYICPICKGHSKLIMNMDSGHIFHMGKIRDIHNHLKERDDEPTE